MFISSIYVSGAEFVYSISYKKEIVIKSTCLEVKEMTGNNLVNVFMDSLRGIGFSSKLIDYVVTADLSNSRDNEVVKFDGNSKEMDPALSSSFYLAKSLNKDLFVLPKALIDHGNLYDGDSKVQFDSLFKDMREGFCDYLWKNMLKDLQTGKSSLEDHH
ncbi:MAG: hypothetical protein Q7R35_20010 [Elusimicrobiota bacterium]|nr:hypothetical protein [Elusimicrobiota bacterium]